MSNETEKKKKSGALLWIVLSAVAVAGLAAGGILISKSVRDQKPAESVAEPSSSEIDTETEPSDPTAYGFTVASE